MNLLENGTPCNVDSLPLEICTLKDYHKQVKEL